MNKKGIVILSVSLFALILAAGFCLVTWRINNKYSKVAENEKADTIETVSSDDGRNESSEEQTARKGSEAEGTNVTEENNPDLKELTIFTGSQTGSDTVLTINAGSGFDMNNVVPDGYFYVEYKADKMRDVKLVLSVWDKNWWKVVSATKTGKLENGAYFAKYSYEAIKRTYGSGDLTDVNTINITSTSEIEVTELKWFGPEVKGDGSVLLYSGSATATGGQSLIAFLFTKHVGGDFDASQINEGSYFAMEYTGDMDKVVLALCSASGATQWVAVPPTSTTTLDNGKYLSTFSIEDCMKKFGTNFKRLDQLQVYTSGNKDTTITLKSLRYYPGTGEIIDSDGESRWTNKSTAGIAFIGDSIVQNAMSLYGDWNKILGRNDCSNWGIGGQTTVHVEKRIDDMLEGNYDAVVILCGINDLGQGVSQNTTIDNYKSMFEKIRRKLPDAKVYVISVLPTRAPYFVGSQQKIAELNNSLKETIEDYDFVTFVDCYSAFVGDDGYCKEEYVFDGLHPNETGYGVIADILNPLLPAAD